MKEWRRRVARENTGARMENESCWTEYGCKNGERELLDRIWVQEWRTRAVGQNIGARWRTRAVGQNMDARLENESCWTKRKYYLL